MRYLLIISLFVLAGHRVVSAAEASGANSVEKCALGTHWKNDCNHCFCLNSGIAVCTRMQCKGSVEEGTVPAQPSGKYCLPGTAWKSQCNYCTCTDNGMPMCTVLPCKEKKIGPKKLCAPHTSWKRGCNTCWCTFLGLPACTLRNCKIDPDSE